MTGAKQRCDFNWLDAIAGHTCRGRNRVNLTGVKSVTISDNS